MSRDYLWAHLLEVPYFRSLMRAVEAGFYDGLDLPSPLLDVGCGDGHFVTVALDRKVEIGIDPFFSPLIEASNRNGYNSLIQAEGARIPFPDGYFGSAMSNSVLEHIPDVDSVLEEVARVLKPGAPFVFCGPNHRFLSGLSIGNFLDKLGFPSLGDGYRSFFNRISRHIHSDSPDIWEDRIQRAGFRLSRWWYYFTPHSLHITEWGHYFGFPSWILRQITGRWILVPSLWNLTLTHHLIIDDYIPGEQSNGVCTFFVANRK